MPTFYPLTNVEKVVAPPSEWIWNYRKRGNIEIWLYTE